MKKVYAIAVIAMICAALLAGCGNNQHKRDARILWTYNIEGGTYQYYASPVLSTDEQTIYLGTSIKANDPQSEYDKLIALNRDGTLKWTYDTGKGEVRSNIAISGGNLFFIADYGRGSTPDQRSKAELISVTPGGQLLWSQQVADIGATSVGLYDIAAHEDKIIVATDTVKVYAASSGELLHQSVAVQNPGSVAMYLRPVIRDDQAYFVSGNRLFIFDISTYDLSICNLKEKNPSLPNLWVTAAIRFDADKNIYIGSTAIFFSIDQNYDLRWIYNTEDQDVSFRSTPCIDPQNRAVYVGTKANEKSKFVALNMDNGTLKWEYVTASDVYSSPALKDNKIYFGSETRKLHVLDTDGAEVYTVDLDEDVTWPSPVIDSRGILYLGGMRGFFYAIQTN